MIGVFCFYITLLESAFERKLVALTQNILPRLYNDISFLYLKKIVLILNKKKQSSFPNKKIRTCLTKNIK
jgi:hypothetical protein